MSDAIRDAAEPPHRAVGLLYQNHHTWLVGWLRRRMDCSHSAADLAQDTFVRLIGGSLPELREPRHYLVTVAKRVLIDHFRRRTLERTYLDALARQPEAEEVSPEVRLQIVETLLALDAMLLGLGHKPRQAFLMSQLLGMNYAEIAERLGVSVSSVTKYIARATEQCLLFALDADL
ncbi:ECF sigma factor, FecI family [Azotobacter vinelandii CA]|uniref:ECF sigma factor, FecI family n=3 Tax=Azotobacter group TaxID=351 RepID=C1DFE8_AZOVD|nr:sigma-70 family RNA polymerase sigma factor [Azotobacter vinelandii]ACO78351.1 ECF sigma factor, FecI family [Azotobacter vinelandii DJ]AGK16769.1 ECF sigma factor, FecI family [Azotobacter vinelandii CA]AGK20436.1 ECF sigma factor, FecI family [Azotobacter vinelandii CA6]WKN24070.1 sigma-70 family RNA polymerase sigma factor [Azotobacter vinelandii]SFY08365.1 RNA polymerase sigma-70 factor, ECF subfamily [Azotobacter vinelandii]